MGGCSSSFSGSLSCIFTSSLFIRLIVGWEPWCSARKGQATRGSHPAPAPQLRSLDPRTASAALGSLLATARAFAARLRRATLLLGVAKQCRDGRLTDLGLVFDLFGHGLGPFGQLGVGALGLEVGLKCLSDLVGERRSAELRQHASSEGGRIM